jgi:hypothetical protein
VTPLDSTVWLWQKSLGRKDVKVPACYITHTVPSYCCSRWSHSTSPVTKSSERNLLVIKLLHNTKFNNTTPLFFLKLLYKHLLISKVQMMMDRWTDSVNHTCTTMKYMHTNSRWYLICISITFYLHVLASDTSSEHSFSFCTSHWDGHTFFTCSFFIPKSLSHMLHASSPNSLQLWSPPKATGFPPVLSSVNVLIRSKYI